MEATGLLTPVVQYMVQLLDEQARLFGGVKDEVTSLQGELNFISKYLDTSEGKRKEHPISKEAIGKIMEKAYEAEDVIDTFILNTSKHTRRNAAEKMIHWSNHAKKLLDLARTIESLNKEINIIFYSSTKFAGESAEASVDAESEEALHRRRREVEEDDVVGFKNDLMALEKLLSANGAELDVISIIGMGGLGKTTLARKIFNTTHIRSRFTHRAWVFASQHDETEELLVKILKEMPISNVLRKNLEGMVEYELKETLSEYLKGKKYLIVIDDIWKTDFWDEVRYAFPDNSNGSRILITSRNKATALKASHTPPYLLPFLNEDESWKLFCKKVFRGEECHPELESLGRQLAKGCRGLPLSIVVLGGILANEKQELLTWSKFIRVNHYLDECKDILALSYTHLPRHLKPCFLYFGAYPEDFEIPVRQLINLWIAEGFIRHDLEDFAEKSEDFIRHTSRKDLEDFAEKRHRHRHRHTSRKEMLYRHTSRKDLEDFAEKSEDLEDFAEISGHTSRKEMHSAEKSEDLEDFAEISGHTSRKEIEYRHSGHTSRKEIEYFSKVRKAIELSEIEYFSKVRKAIEHTSRKDLEEAVFDYTSRKDLDLEEAEEAFFDFAEISGHTSRKDLEDFSEKSGHTSRKDLEDFAEKSGHTSRKDLEDFAEKSYLQELIDRSLIQVASRRTDGGVKTCCIHTLMRDLCISVNAELKFMEVRTENNHLSTNKSRRLSIQGRVDPYISSNPSQYFYRSLLFLGQDTYDFDPNHWKWVVEYFKLLRVLNFGRVNLYSIPTRIQDLIHLRFLRIESIALKAIPASIGNLTNLETLDMRGTCLDCLPTEIWKLRRLKNLYMSGPVSLPQDMRPEAEWNLQVLSTASLNPQTLLPNVRKLGIWFASDKNNSEVTSVLKSLRRLPRLQTLKIINYSEHALPTSLSLTITTTKITLRRVLLDVARDMRDLGKLSNLKILKLQSCLLSGKLYVFKDSFLQLRVLQLENLRINEWNQEERAMPKLQHLIIKQCIKLTIVPRELRSLIALRDVEVLWSTPELAKMFEKLRVPVGFKLLIDPPLDADFYKQTAA